MQTRRIEAISRTVAEIATAARPSGELREEELGRLLIHDNVRFVLDGESAEKLDIVVDTLVNRDGLGAKFSESFIEKRVLSIIVSALVGGSSSNIEPAIEQFVQGYQEYAIEQTVLLPVFGLELATGPLEIGMVTLETIDESAQAELERSVQAVLARTSDSDELRRLHADNMKQEIENHFAGQVVSRFRAVAEPGRALERAEEETRRASDILRYAIRAFHSAEQRVALGLPGDVSRARRRHLLLSDESCGWGSQMVGALRPFRVDRDKLDHMQRIGVPAFSDILRRSITATSDFERSLINALHWFALSQNQAERENGFLNLVTCLETLLTPRDGNPIGVAIAEGTAILLGGTLSARKALKRHVREFYSKRSAVSHGGGKVILAEEYRELEEIAGSLLATLVRRRGEFSSQKALFEWIEDQRLGGSNDAPGTPP